MPQIPAVLADNPDRLRWNERYRDAGYVPSFTAHPLAVRALSMPLPDGPVLELACGPSGTALFAAAEGRLVTAVDASDVALGMLEQEARRRHLDGRITLVPADLAQWRPGAAGYALVLCTGYWDRATFAAAARSVRPRGMIGWEALTEAARRDRPQLPPEWCVGPGEPAALLPASFEVISHDDATPEPATRRRLLARRQGLPRPDWTTEAWLAEPQLPAALSAAAIAPPTAWCGSRRLGRSHRPPQRPQPCAGASGCARRQPTHRQAGALMS